MRLAPLILLVIAACTPAPELPGTGADVDLNAPYPALVPIGPILAAAAVPGATAPTGTLDARAAALNDRADGLRGPLIDAETQTRLDAGIDSTALQ